MWENRAALYDVDQQRAIQKTIDPRMGESVLAFAYPPTTAFLLAPLGRLSFSTAYLVMVLINLSALLLVLYLLATHLDLNKEQTQWLLLITFCSFGVQSAILQGQTSLLLVLLVAFFMRSVRRGDQTASALWNAALFLKPQLVPVPLLVLAAQRRRRALGWAILLIAGLAVASVLLVGWDGISEYFRIARRFGGLQSDLGTNPQDMHNLRALVHYALPAPLIIPAWIGAAMLVAGGVLLLNTKVRADEVGAASQWVGNFSAIVLLSPHLHSHDLALLIPAHAFILKTCQHSIPASVSSSLLALGIFPLLPWIFGTSLPPVMPLVFLIGFVGCVLLVRCGFRPHSEQTARVHQ